MLGLLRDILSNLSFFLFEDLASCRSTTFASSSKQTVHLEYSCLRMFRSNEALVSCVPHRQATHLPTIDTSCLIFQDRQCLTIGRVRSIVISKLTVFSTPAG